MLATRRDGADSDRAQRFRRVGRDLVMSIQPKGSPMLRKKFLMQLPPLMKDLNEGMQLIGWPEPAQKEFFGKLLPGACRIAEGPAAVRARPQPDGQAARGRSSRCRCRAPSRLRARRAVPEVDAEVDRAALHARGGGSRSAWSTRAAVDWTEPVDLDIDIDLSAPTCSRPSRRAAESRAAARAGSRSAGARIGPTTDVGRAGRADAAGRS